MNNPLQLKTKIETVKQLVESCRSVLTILNHPSSYHDVSWGENLYYKVIGNNQFLFTLLLGKYLPEVCFVVDHSYIVSLKLPKLSQRYDWKFEWPFKSECLTENEINNLREKTLKQLRIHRTDNFKIVSESSRTVQYATKHGKYKGFFLDKLLCKFTLYLRS